MTSLAAQSPTRTRSFAAWVALLVLLGVGHVVPALHFLFVAHQLCAEHGELVDVAGESVERSREKGPNPGVYAGGGAAHTHEHCGVLTLAPTPAAQGASLRGVQRLAAGEVASVPGEARAAHIGIELLLYAPKLAPPSAALAAL